MGNSKSLTNIKSLLESKPFIPSNYNKNSHIQTIRGIISGNKEIKNTQRKILNLSDGSQIAGDCLWQKEKKTKTLIVIHGLTGSSKSPYVVRLCNRAYNQGYNTIALNLRNCGHTENLTKTLYNAGQSKDLMEVIKQLEKEKIKEIFIIGSSLSGNLCLKLVGEESNKLPKIVKALAVISPLVDIKETAKESDLPRNKLYRYFILKSLKKLIKKKSIIFPNIYNFNLTKKVKTVRDYDELFQAPISGYKNAEEYYEKCSSNQFIKNIKIPTLIIYSQDDPLVPANTIDKLRINKNIIFLKTEYGGHVGFIDKNSNFWADDRIMEFFRLVK